MLGRVVSLLTTALLTCVSGLAMAQYAPTEQRGTPPTEAVGPRTHDLADAVGPLGPDQSRTRWRRDVLLPAIRQGEALSRAAQRLGAPGAERLRGLLAQAQPSSESGLPGVGLRETGPTVPLTLERSLQLALEKNFTVRISSLSAEAARTEIDRARARFHPTAGVAAAVSGNDDPDPETSANTQSVQPFITQELPTGGSLTLSYNVARDEPTTGGATVENGVSVRLVHPLLRGVGVLVATKPIRDAMYDLRVEQARLGADVLRVMADTKIAYYNAILSEKVLEVTQGAIERDQALIDASRALFEAGLTTRRDVISAELELAKDSARLASALADVESTRDALLDILGIPIGTNARLLDQAIEYRAQPLDLGGWVQRAVANRPEILGIQHQIQKSELNIAFARNRLLPALDLTASYSRFDTGSAFSRVVGIREQEWAIGLVFSVPIGNAAARAELRRAEIGHAQLREILASRQRQVELEVRSSVIKLVRSSERVKALRAAIQQAEEKLEVAKTQFSLGLITNFDITDAQEDLRAANVDLLGAIVDYNIGLAELEARIAGPVY